MNLTETYEKMAADGIVSNLRMTLKVETGTKTLFFYDIGAQAVEDPLKRLSSEIVIGTHDSGRYINVENDKIWIKEYSDVMRPRWLEGFIGEYGVENVSIHEIGKYSQHLETLGSIFKTANDLL